MKNFSEFFEPYMKKGGLPAAIGAGNIESMKIDAQHRSMALHVAFSQPVERRLLFDAEQALAASDLNLSMVEINPRFPAQTFSVEYVPQLMAELGRKFASLQGTIGDATAALEKDELTVFLKHGGMQILEEKKFDRELIRLIQQEFGLTVQVKFDGVLSLEHDDAQYIEHQKHRQEKQRRRQVVEQVEEYESKMAAKEAKPHTISVRTGDTLLPTVCLDSVRPIYGKLGKAAPVPISRVSPDFGSVTIWGEVFALEQKETRDGSKKIYSINVTDYTGSMSLKIIEDKNQCKALDAISKGDSLLIRGEISYDKYDREVVLRPRAIGAVERVQVVDDAETKRVELHLHTNMSSMDGMNTAGDLIARAAKWGHKAVAITDHGVAQAFPDAMNAAARIKKNGGSIKVLYGTEAYFVNDMNTSRLISKPPA